MEKEMELETRKAVLDCIRRFPGIHLREIQRKLDMPMGSLEYHLIFLERHRLVSVERDGHYKRYYAARSGIKDRTLLSLLRQETPRRIVIFLLENEDIQGELNDAGMESQRDGKAVEDQTLSRKAPEVRAGVRHREIAEAVGVSPSTLSFHLKKLERAGVVEVKKKGRERYYRVKDRDKVIETLLTYRESFLDSVVDRFAELWLDVGLE